MLRRIVTEVDQSLEKSWIRSSTVYAVNGFSLTTEDTEVNRVEVSSVSTLSLAQNGREVPAPERETLFNAASHGYFGAGRGDPVLSSENPHCSGVIINEECASSQSPVGINDAAGNCDLFTGIAARIAVDLGDVFSWRTAHQQQNSYGK
jgi:hypothetical protein